MKPHDQLIIFANRHRARDLRMFRDLVEVYFDRSQRDPDGVPVDWEGAQAARARINRMLPRVLEIVHAAGLGDRAPAVTTDPGLQLGRVEVLHRIFVLRYADGAEQEVLDLLDMAIGVYDGGRLGALGRTINPLHYVATAVRFLARGPRRLFRSLGFGRRRPPSRLAPHDLARLETAAERLEELLEQRLAVLQDRLSVRHGEYARQLAELAERLDFAERVLAQQRPPGRLAAPEESDVSTPV